MLRVLGSVHKSERTRNDYEALPTVEFHSITDDCGESLINLLVFIPGMKFSQMPSGIVYKIKSTFDSFHSVYS